MEGNGSPLLCTGQATQFEALYFLIQNSTMFVLEYMKNKTNLKKKKKRRGNNHNLPLVVLLLTFCIYSSTNFSWKHTPFLHI